MTKTIRKEILIPQPREQVWRALTDSTMLAEWMFPNDFAPVIGHHFTFQVPPNPKASFDGLVVSCEVLECDPPSQLAFSWSAGQGTRLFLVHSGFDVSQPWIDQAVRGAEFGWSKMLGQLSAVVARNLLG